MARRIVRHIRHQYEPGVYLPFKPGEIVVDDHPFADHWFIVENSVDEPHPEPDAPLAPRPPADDEPPFAPDEGQGADEGEGAPGAENDKSGETDGERDEETDADKALESEGVTRDDLIAHATALGITVDRRWGVARLQAVIDAAQK